MTTSYAFQPHANLSPLGTPDLRARINVLATLFNGYLDLGTWYGVTPYVGGGIGFSYLRPIQFTSVSVPPSVASNSGTFDFSWDLTVNATFQKNTVSGLPAPIPTGPLSGQGVSGTQVETIRNGYAINSFWTRIYTGLDKASTLFADLRAGNTVPNTNLTTLGTR